MTTGKWWSRPLWTYQDERVEDWKYFPFAQQKTDFSLRRLTTGGTPINRFYSNPDIKMTPPPVDWSPRTGE